MLQQHGVADDEVRPGEARDLVRREVPRHDAEDHAVRAAANDRGSLAGEQLDRLVLHEIGPVVRVERVDVDAEVDLPERLLQRLAHLARGDLGKLLPPLGVQLADPAHELGAFVDRARSQPVLIGVVCQGDSRIQLFARDRRELLHLLSCCGVRHRVDAHRSPPFCVVQPPRPPAGLFENLVCLLYLRRQAEGRVAPPLASDCDFWL